MRTKVVGRFAVQPSSVAIGFARANPRQPSSADSKSLFRWKPKGEFSACLFNPLHADRLLSPLHKTTGRLCCISRSPPARVTQQGDGKGKKYVRMKAVVPFMHMASGCCLRPQCTGSG